MEFLLFVIVTIILVIVLGIRKIVIDRLRILDTKIDHLAAELKKAQLRTDAVKDASARPGTAEEARVVQPSRVPPPVLKPDSTSDVEPPRPLAEKVQPVPASASPASPGQPETTPEVVRIPGAIRPPVARPPKPKQPGFFERNPDLEKFIGENLANKIGIGVLVLGIGFFVKYAIDRDWIGEIGRVFIGVLCGGILLGVAHRLRRTFTAFSSVLVGGGIAVLYLTIAIAFHEYGIFSQSAAFVLMLIITGFAVVLSLAYNRIELAVLSILGGFASPFMVSTGEGNYVVLFVYVLTLDVGMLVLAYYKKWNLVNIISYVFTVLLFGGWLAVSYDGLQPPPIAGALIFATLFYLVFFAMNIVNNVKERTAFKAIEISILLSNTFCYYAAGMIILSAPHASLYKGLFTATLAIFNFVFAFALYKNSRVDKNLVFLLIGLVLTFVSLAAPVQLEGNYITMFWSAETVLLLWLSQKSGIRLMKLGSVVLMVLMIFSLVMDWSQIYNAHVPPLMAVIFNKGYITGLVSIASIVLSVLFLRNEHVKDKELVGYYTIALAVAGGIVVYVSQLLELQYQLFNRGFDYPAQNVIIGSFNLAFILALLMADRKWIRDSRISFAFAAWGALAMVAYVIFYQAQIIEARDRYVLGEGSATGYVFHYVLLALMIIVAIITLRKVRANVEFNRSTGNAYAWVFVIFFVFLASAELDHLLVVLLGSSDESIDRILTQNHKIGFPILWGLASFILIFLGLKRKQKHIRIVSLSLFLFTLLKLFIVDIRGISEGGKIAAFISLGVLLLIVSFMYQRLKKILLSDEAVAATNKTDAP
ncbi:MAG TPA: DUF2339 domain-containing protein [Chryseolinea sp.]|nr:DUF2339 domain-containing protein [Chryseolinea sp.]